MNLVNALVASQGGYSPSFYRRPSGFEFQPNPNFSTVPGFGPRIIRIRG